MNEVKWGIIGSGNIAGKFVENIKSVKNAKLIACSSKDFDKAYKFKKKHNIENFYGNHEEMLKNPSIDAVYIATTHNFHYENALLCIRYGKHILCEKTFTINAAQAKEVFRQAKEKNLFVMEAMWTRFLPVTRWMKEQIQNGEIGEPLSVSANFGLKFPYNPESRLFDIHLAGGGLLDLGIYAISFACNIFGTSPVKISSVAKLGATGVDEQASLSLLFNEGQMATLSWSLVAEYDREATVHGTRGKIILDQTSAPTKGRLIKYREQNDDYMKQETTMEFESFYNNGFENEIKEATDLILQRKFESPTLSWEDTVGMLEICDAARAQWNFKYPGE